MEAFFYYKMYVLLRLHIIFRLLEPLLYRFNERISRRIESHLWSRQGFTSKAKDWQLRYQEVFETKTEALTREKHIKRWKSRKMIEKLISGNL